MTSDKFQAIRDGLIEFSSLLVTDGNLNGPDNLLVANLPSELGAYERARQLMAELGDVMKYLEIIPGEVKSPFNYAILRSDQILPDVTVSLWQIDQASGRSIYLMQSPPPEPGKQAVSLEGVAKLIAQMRDGEAVFVDEQVLLAAEVQCRLGGSANIPSARPLAEFAGQACKRFGVSALNPNIQAVQAAVLASSDEDAAEGQRIFAETVPDADIPALQAAVIASGNGFEQARFATSVPGANIAALQTAVIGSRDGNAQFLFASSVPGADIAALQAAVLVSDDGSRLGACSSFARHVTGVDIPALQQVILDGNSAIHQYVFATSVPGADVAALQARVIVSGDYGLMANFARNVSGADTAALMSAIVVGGALNLAVDLAVALQDAQGRVVALDIPGLQAAALASVDMALIRRIASEVVGADALVLWNATCDLGSDQDVRQFRETLGDRFADVQAEQASAVADFEKLLAQRGDAELCAGYRAAFGRSPS